MSDGWSWLVSGCMLLSADFEANRGCTLNRNLFGKYKHLELR